MALVILRRTFSMTQKWAEKGVWWLQESFVQPLFQTVRSEEGAHTALAPILHSANCSWAPAPGQLAKTLHSPKCGFSALSFRSPDCLSIFPRILSHPGCQNWTHLPSKEVKWRAEEWWAAIPYHTIPCHTLGLQDRFGFRSPCQLCSQPRWHGDTGMNTFLWRAHHC